MNRNFAVQNIESLLHIALRFEELSKEITFVGGCILGLLITDQAAPDVRYTVDVDCIINVISISDYHALSKKLRQKGFQELLSGNHPICRWDCDGILVDIVPTEEKILGFSNYWYKEAHDSAINIALNDVTTIKVISAPYFLATKLEAFKDRGNEDFLCSHDLEDIISLIDGRPEIVEDIYLAQDKIQEYLAMEFTRLSNNIQFRQALPGHLNYSHEFESRKEIVENRIKKIIENKKIRAI